jgi:tRNA(Met) C34 N-acetyltransferase TmcA
MPIAIEKLIFLHPGQLKACLMAFLKVKCYLETTFLASHHRTCPNSLFSLFNKRDRIVTTQIERVSICAACVICKGRSEAVAVILSLSKRPRPGNAIPDINSPK